MNRPDLTRFLATLADIEASVELVNPRRVVEWNLLKTYLGELAAKGLAVVPTRFGDRLETGEVAGLAGTGERIVIKPQVGATAMGTYVIDGGTPPEVIDEIDSLERSEITTVQYTRWREQFLPFLLSGLGLLVLHRLLSDTRFRSLP